MTSPNRCLPAAVPSGSREKNVFVLVRNLSCSTQATRLIIYAVALLTGLKKKADPKTDKMRRTLAQPSVRPQRFPVQNRALAFEKLASIYNIESVPFHFVVPREKKKKEWKNKKKNVLFTRFISSDSLSGTSGHCLFSQGRPLRGTILHMPSWGRAAVFAETTVNTRNNFAGRPCIYRRGPQTFLACSL